MNKEEQTEQMKPQTPAQPVLTEPTQPASCSTFRSSLAKCTAEVPVVALAVAHVLVDAPVRARLPAQLRKFRAADRRADAREDLGAEDPDDVRAGRRVVPPQALRHEQLQVRRNLIAVLLSGFPPLTNDEKDILTGFQNRTTLIQLFFFYTYILNELCTIICQFQQIASPSLW